MSVADLLAMVNIQGQSWRRSAACRALPKETFFDPSPSRTKARQAKAVCASCPVQSECLQYALDNAERWGIFGGLTEAERRELLTERRVPRPCAWCGTAFTPVKSDQSCCRRECVDEAAHERNKERNKQAAQARGIAWAQGTRHPRPQGALPRRADAGDDVLDKQDALAMVRLA